MPPKRKTRSVSGDKYAGGPCDLPDSDLPTHGDVVRHFYFVSITEKDYLTQIHLVEEKIIQVWQKCNPRLPLRQKKKIYDKLKGFLDSVKCFDQKKLKLQARKYLLSQKDKLFDIAACCCSLPVVTCDNPSVKCKANSCASTHILCKCPLESKIPAEDREYMRDQRQKTGTRGAFQMRGRDMLAAAQDRAKQQRAATKMERMAQNKQQVRHEHLDQVVVNPHIEVSPYLFTWLD
jgi:hypothetical protein